ncbi:proteinase-activated receptor 1-like [Labrus bergylta]|uniref:proteinase-activated receptor 1-like n=1 Tax=Labrus bergylta TaxID=56723 RepID=UPI003313F4E9
MTSLFGRNMFSMCPKSLLFFALVCACAASTGAKNDSAFGRTFTSTSYDSPAYEDLLQYMEPDHIDKGPVSSLGPNITNTSSASGSGYKDVVPVLRKNNNPFSRRLPSNTSRQGISKEARLFLTGPVSTVLIPSFYTLVCLISVPINICAVVVLARRIRPKKPAAIYMLNLACADLLFAMVLPFKISYHFNGNDWIFGPAMCRVVTAAFYWNMYCSILLIALISVDRLLAVVYPIDSLSWRSPRNAIIACLAVWFLSFTGSLHLLFTEQTYPATQLNITTCHDVQPSELFWAYKTYFLTLCCLLFFLPLIITVVSYTRVIMTLSKVPPGVPGHSRKRRRAVVIALTVLVIFVLCFTPSNCFLLLQHLQFTEGDALSREVSDSLYVVYLVFLCLGSLNCLLDPLVYYFGSSQFQRELCSVLRCKKITQGTSRIQHSSSDPSRSSSRTLLKSSHKESSQTNTPLNKMDSFQASPSSQYKKLMV